MFLKKYIISVCPKCSTRSIYRVKGVLTKKERQELCLCQKDGTRTNIEYRTFRIIPKTTAGGRKQCA